MAWSVESEGRTSNKDGSRLAAFVTDQRVFQLAHVIRSSTKLQTISLTIQTVLLVFYSIFLGSFWIWSLVVEIIFLVTSIVVLATSFSTNPSEQQIRRASVFTRVSFLAGLLAVLLALFSPGDPFAFMFFLPGLVLSYASFLDRRIVARDIGLRKLRGVPVGLFGNLAGMMAEMNDYGIEPSTRFEWKRVAAGILLFMGLMIEAILRADAGSHFVETATGFRELLIFAAISGIIGFIVGVWLEDVKTRWNTAVKGKMKLDSLEKSRFWFYHRNGELISYRLLARPLISAKDDEMSIIVAHYPASFEIRVSSDGNYQRLLSVLQDDQTMTVPGDQ